MTEVIIEYRCPLDDKLKDLIFDEPQWYVQQSINVLKTQGVTEFTVIKNQPKYKLNLNETL